jgi:hypothetical protein
MARRMEDVWVLGVGEARRLLTRVGSVSEFLVVGDGSSTYAGLEKSDSAKPELGTVLEYVLSEVKRKMRLCPKEDMLKSTLSVVLGLQELSAGIRGVVTRDVSSDWFCR